MLDSSGHGTETSYVVPAVSEYLNNSKITHATEVTFDLIDDKGEKIVSGRFDVVFRDPRNGQLVAIELKGDDIDQLHGNQTEYIHVLESAAGGRIRFTSDKVEALGLKKGGTHTVNEDHYFRMDASRVTDFGKALSEITGGKTILHRYINSATGETKFFTSQKDFESFLKQRFNVDITGKSLGKKGGKTKEKEKEHHDDPRLPDHRGPKQKDPPDDPPSGKDNNDKKRIEEKKEIGPRQMTAEEEMEAEEEANRELEKERARRRQEVMEQDKPIESPSIGAEILAVGVLAVMVFIARGGKAPAAAAAPGGAAAAGEGVGALKWAF